MFGLNSSVSLMWVVCMLLSANAWGLSQSFYKVGEKSITYEFDSSLRVLSSSGGADRPLYATGLGKFSEADLRAFQQAKMLIAPVSHLPSRGDYLGVPVSFVGGGKGAMGVLTDEMILRPKQQGALTKVRVMPGFLGLKESVLLPQTYLIKFQSEVQVARAVASMAGSSDVEFVHPNFIFLKTWRNQEPFEGYQWHLRNTGQLGGIAGADGHIAEAWGLVGNGRGVPVAVIDAGFELEHQDLVQNWMANPQEIPGNQRDDDQNGLVDDVFGWNFLDHSSKLGGTRLERHGTAVAGVLAAAVNGLGVAGVCPGCKMIPIVAGLRVMEDAEAFAYAMRRGAQVISNSWGYVTGTPETDVLTRIIDEVAENGRQGKGVPIVFAMNNINQNDCDGPYPDISSLPSVVAVSGVTDRDQKVSYGAWGPCMELLAPTNEKNRPKVATTDLSGQSGYNNGRYPDDFEDPNYTNYFHGTSAAAPQVAGAMGLLLALVPELTRQQLIASLLLSADKVDPMVASYDLGTGFSVTHGYGRLNLARAASLLLKLKKPVKNPH